MGLGSEENSPLVKIILWREKLKSRGNRGGGHSCSAKRKKHQVTKDLKVSAKCGNAKKMENVQGGGKQKTKSRKTTDNGVPFISMKCGAPKTKANLGGKRQGKKINNRNARRGVSSWKVAPVLQVKLPYETVGG